MKKITFCDHALLKFQVLKEHGFRISKKKIKDVIKSPDNIVKGYKSRMVANKILDKSHTLRVVYEEHKNVIEIVTFYPTRRERYENKL